ncbi:MAG: 50S ribosomal protein L4 [Eubacterium sp.]|nr:50S ribosomal protein L4 [Eubacterium sp.]
MATVSVYNMEGSKVGTMELNDAVFGAKINEHLVHMSVVQYLANKRQGTQKAKTRSEVSGGGRKPWRQKGTGHARQGSIRAPQWKGGGVVFAPTPRDYSFKLNKKEKIAALKSALTSRVQDGKIYVMDELAFGEIKTKKMADVLKGLGVQKAFIVTNDVDKNVFCSARNIPNVKTGFITKVNTTDKKTGEEKELLSSTLNVYDILKYNNLVITKAAVELIEEVYA